MGPLLIWALRFVEDFSTDILAGHAENQRLHAIATAAKPHHASEGVTALRAYLCDLESTGKPLPAGSREGKPTVARYYIAGITGCPASTVQKALRQPKWQRYLAKNPGPCPLDVPITATMDDSLGSRTSTTSRSDPLSHRRDFSSPPMTPPGPGAQSPTAR
jgi:hypothetical protein